MGETASLESRMKRLEEIVAQMERDELPLEKAIELFQEGMSLGKECRSVLDSIGLQVEKVLNATDDDSVTTERMDEQL